MSPKTRYGKTRTKYEWIEIIGTFILLLVALWAIAAFLVGTGRGT